MIENRVKQPDKDFGVFSFSIFRLSFAIARIERGK
jgi:hypothetical protein